MTATGGVGRALLEEALVALEALGAPRVLLSGAERSAAAQRLFAGAGFRQTTVEMTRERGAMPNRALDATLYGTPDGTRG